MQIPLGHTFTLFIFGMSAALWCSFNVHVETAETHLSQWYLQTSPEWRPEIRDMSLSVLLFIIGEAKSVTLTVVSYFVGKIVHRSSQGLEQGCTSLFPWRLSARNFCTPSLQNIQL